MNELSVSKSLVSLAGLFAQRGKTLYAVGGMVRNPILGLAVSDCDICSAMRPDEVASLCAENDLRCFAKGAAFGTLDIVFGGERFEYACFRSESYASGGAHRPDSVRYSDSVEEDAARRDFTVNALYLDILQNSIIDPTGGLRDISDRVIRATSDDPGAIMGDDALRILRMARFCGELGFRVDQATLDAARCHAAGLSDISPERIRDELSKLLLCDVRYGAGTQSMIYALDLLRLCGAYDVFLPELTACFGVEQRRKYHAYDVYGHAIHAAASVPPELTLRLTMLLHDIGKPVALADHGKMHGHELIGADMADGVLRRLRYPNALRQDAVSLIRWHMFDLNGDARDRACKKRFVALGRDLSEKLCLVRDADVHGSGIITGPVDTAEKWRRILNAMRESGAPFTEGELACTGRDIAGWLDIAPCARIGEIKRALLMHCACKPSDNTYERLRAIVRDMGPGKEGGK